MIPIQVMGYAQQPTSTDRQRVAPSDTVERRRRYLLRWTTVKGERTRQWTKWQDLTNFILPERGRFLSSDHNKPKDTSKILNNIPTKAARALAAGLMSGVTSPARPWFNLTFENQELADDPRAKLYAHQYTVRMRRVLEVGGFYKAMAMGVYPDLVTFGTACCFVEEDLDTIVRFNPLAIGQYGLAQDGKAHINTVLHEEAWTVSELVDEFGWESVSNSVRTAYNSGAYEQYILVLHVVEPNTEFLPGMADRRGKPWGSVWMEIGGLGQSSGALVQPSSDPAIGFLRQSGYNEFPALCPRWTTTGRDVYGTGPGHDALPDSKQIMKLESRALLTVDKGVNPALVVPENMRLQKLNALPGDTIYRPTGDNSKIEPAYVPLPAMMDKVEMKIRQAEQRVGSAFFSDLVAMFINDGREGVQPVTAEEIAAKKEEKMLLLGPVLENLNDELLSPAIERVAAIMERRGLTPPAPPELQGQVLKVQFTSILAQAQKMIGTGSKERLLMFVGQVGQVSGSRDPLDNLDFDKLVRDYADDLGVAPDDMADPQVVAAKRQERAKQAQAQAQGAAMAQAAASAKDASKADMGGDNLLTRLAGPQAAAIAGGEGGQL